MTLRRMPFVLAALLLVLASAGDLVAQVKIATVDLHRAIMETEDGRRARRRLESEFSARQRQLDQAQQEIESTATELENQRNVVSQAVYAERRRALEQRVVEVQRQFVEFQQELAQHEAQLTRTIVERMQTILREIGAAEGYTAILDTSSGTVVYSPANIDLTDTLIQRYNAQAPAVSGGGGMGMDGDDAPAMTAMTGMGTMTGMTATMAPAP